MQCAHNESSAHTINTRSVDTSNDNPTDTRSNQHQWELQGQNQMGVWYDSAASEANATSVHISHHNTLHHRTGTPLPPNQSDTSIPALSNDKWKVVDLRSTRNFPPRLIVTSRFAPGLHHERYQLSASPSRRAQRDNGRVSLGMRQWARRGEHQKNTPTEREPGRPSEQRSLLPAGRAPESVKVRVVTCAPWTTTERLAEPRRTRCDVRLKQQRKRRRGCWPRLLLLQSFVHCRRFHVTCWAEAGRVRPVSTWGASILGPRTDLFTSGLFFCFTGGCFPVWQLLADSKGEMSVSQSPFRESPQAHLHPVGMLRFMSLM